MRRTEFVDVVRRYYEDHRQGLYTYALALTGRRQAAEDVVHTVFCKLLARGRPPRDMGPYVLRSVRNAAIDELARRGNAKPAESMPSPEPGTPMTIYIIQTDSQLPRGAFDTTTDDYVFLGGSAKPQVQVFDLRHGAQENGGNRKTTNGDVS